MLWIGVLLHYEATIKIETCKWIEKNLKDVFIGMTVHDSVYTVGGIHSTRAETAHHTTTELPSCFIEYLISHITSGAYKMTCISHFIAA